MCDSNNNDNDNSNLPNQELCHLNSKTFLQMSDAPRYKWRGLMLDTSRHYYPFQALERIIDGMVTKKQPNGLYKMEERKKKEMLVYVIC